MANLNSKWNLRIPKEILDIIKENVNNGKFNNISDGLRYYLKEGISNEKTVSDIAEEISNNMTIQRLAEESNILKEIIHMQERNFNKLEEEIKKIQKSAHNYEESDWNLEYNKINF